MKYLKSYNEISSYLNLHGNDDYEITQVKRDNSHKYEYCDGVLYELSIKGEDFVVDIDEVEHTEENLFYPDQIEKYVEYIQDGGVIQTFPVSSSKVCNNLDEMLDHLDDRDNFDETYDLLNRYHTKLFDIFIGKGLWDISSDPEEYGFIESVPSVNLKFIKNIADLDEYYNEDGNEKYDEELYFGFVAIIEYFIELETYSLLDFNHRFAALKEMGKSRVMVEIM